MQDEAVLAEYAAEVEEKAKAGMRLSIALDEVLRQRLDPKMHANDKLLVRDAVLDIVNQRKIETIAKARMEQPAPTPTPRRVIGAPTGIPFVGGRIPRRNSEYSTREQQLPVGDREERESA